MASVGAPQWAPQAWRGVSVRGPAITSPRRRVCFLGSPVPECPKQAVTPATFKTLGVVSTTTTASRRHVQHQKGSLAFNSSRGSISPVSPSLLVRPVTSCAHQGVRHSAASPSHSWSQTSVRLRQARRKDPYCTRRFRVILTRMTRSSIWCILTRCDAGPAPRGICSMCCARLTN